MKKTLFLILILFCPLVLFAQYPIYPPSILSLSDSCISTQTVGQVLTYDGTCWTNDNAQTINGGAGVDFYYDDTASDIATYQVLNRSPENVAENTVSAVANNGRTLIKAYASASAGQGATTISAGEWVFDFYAYTDVIGLGLNSLDIDVLKRTSGGTETLLFNINTGTILNITGSIQLYTIQTVQAAFTVNATDRIVIKVYAKTTAVVNRTVYLVYGGSTHYSNLNTPLVLITIASGKSFTVNNTLTLAGTDATTITFQGTDTYVGRATTDTLTNKTLTTPIISTISNTGTVTLPTATDTLVARATTDTLTNKRINPRVTTGGGTCDTASSATPTPVGDSCDEYEVTAQAAAAAFAAPSGTPSDGQKLILRVKDNGTARAETWNSIYRASSSLALPTTTTISKTQYLGFLYNGADSKWDLVTFLDNF